MMDNHKQPDYLRILYFIIGILAILYVGKTLFIPLSFSIFICFVLYPLCRFLESRKVPRSIAILISIILLLLPVAGLIILLVRQVLSFQDKFPLIKKKIPGAVTRLTEGISEFAGIEPSQLKSWVQESLSGSLSIMDFIQQTITLSAVSLVLILLIPVYVALILYYRTLLLDVMNRLISGVSKEELRSIMNDTAKTYYRFVSGMAIVYLIVGVLNSLGLFFLNIPDPIFFGFVASILTMVPYVGIMVGGIVPFSIALISNESFWYPLGVVGVLSIVQILEANIIFPLAVGNRLELNPLVVLLAIIAGGILWGVSGMILFIPALAILKLISSKVESMEPLSRLLGRTE